MNEPNTKNAGWSEPPVILWYLLLAGGGLLRIAVWLQNRSLFIDEANLARNFCQKSWADLFQPLSYEQYAPPLFSLVQKISVGSFGQQELALRLFPLLCGLFSLYLFYWTIRRLSPSGWIGLAALWIFCCSDFLLRYATEGKQYASDGAVALGLVALSLAFAQRPFRPVWAATIGALAIWLSMPAVFVLFGAGLFFLQKYWAEKDWRSFRKVALAVLVWLLSFAGYYWLLLGPTLAFAPLVDYHKSWFFPLLPSSKADWLQARDLLLSFPYYTAGYTVLALLVGSAGILTGLLFVFRRRKELAFLLAVPVLSCLLVSGFGLYSLIPRMLVWAIPLVLLLQMLGWQEWWTAGKRWYWRLACVLLIVPTLALHRSLKYLVEPFQIEEIRLVLDTIHPDFQAGDLLYVSHETWPAVAYYHDCHEQRAGYQFAGRVMHGNWDQQPVLETVSAAGGTPRRVWLVYSHVVSDAARLAMQSDLEQIGQYATQKKVLEQTGARGYLYEIGPR